MKYLITFPHLPIFALLSILLSFWAFSDISVHAGNGVAQSWQAFIENSSKMASDHNKMTDCLTDGEEF